MGKIPFWRVAEVRRKFADFVEIGVQEPLQPGTVVCAYYDEWGRFQLARFYQEELEKPEDDEGNGLC